MSEFRSGFVALLGKPNVGKSTLLNRMVGTKVAITSPKPGTTRRRVLGVRHGPGHQIVFVDTPGFYPAENMLGSRMLKSAQTEGQEADVVLLVTEGTHLPTDDDRRVAEFLQGVRAPKLLVVNKVDLVKPKEALLPRLEAYRDLGVFEEIFPVSATEGDNLDRLLEALVQRLPEGHPYFPEDQVSDQNREIMAEEIIREKVLRNTRQEVPHAVAVQIEEFRPGENPDTHFIRAIVYVEREGQKAILVGKGGAMLKKIGSQAREELEVHYGKRVFLDLWVKVKEDWRDRSDWLRALGYE